MTMPAVGLPAAPASSLSSWPRAALALPVSVGAGVLLGVGDLVWNIGSPGPWATVANSSAVWAVAAFVLGVVALCLPLTVLAAAVFVALGVWM